MKILISHVFGTENKGDWILVWEMIEILKNAFPE
jgi:polysaccharide pyruvyl transferase WcaK-like protein